jgi:hypothetical protein
MVKVRDWGDGSPPHWARDCRMCDLLARALVHEHWARVFRKRAGEILRKRLEAKKS